MPSLIRIAGFLPLSKARKLALKARLLDSAFHKDIERARGARNFDAVRHLEDQHQFEARMMQEEMDQEYSDRLVQTASQLRVPIPRWRDEEGELTTDWLQGTETGYIYLSEKGIDRVREAIRSEERWNQEKRAHWILWITALTGLVGAITGLVAIASR